MKLMKIILLVFAVSLAQAQHRKNENTSKKQPQVNKVKFAFLPSLVPRTVHNSCEKKNGGEDTSSCMISINLLARGATSSTIHDYES